MAVYFIRCTETGRIKIGKSDNPESRFIALEGASATRLELLKIVPGDTTLERELHEKLEQYRIKNHRDNFTEWFHGVKEVYEAIDATEESFGTIRRVIKKSEKTLRELIRDLIERPMIDGHVNPAAFQIDDLQDKISKLQSRLSYPMTDKETGLDGRLLYSMPDDREDQDRNEQASGQALC